MNTYQINFRNLKDKQDDYEKLYFWCNQKFIYDWFEQRKLTYDEIVNKYQNKLKDKKQDLYMIQMDNIEIGFVQIYQFAYDITIHNFSNHDNVYEYDLFIGNKDYISKGIGAIIVQSVNQLIQDMYHADAIILRPFKRNARAVKCYRKCGFETIQEYYGEDTIGNKEIVTVLLYDCIKKKREK